MKIKVNDNLINIINFIRSNPEKLTFYEVIQYCIDYDQYKEVYQNYHIIKDLILEHNKEIDLGIWKEVK